MLFCSSAATSTTSGDIPGSFVLHSVPRFHGPSSAALLPTLSAWVHRVPLVGESSWSTLIRLSLKSISSVPLAWPIQPELMGLLHSHHVPSLVVDDYPMDHRSSSAKSFLWKAAPICRLTSGPVLLLADQLWVGFLVVLEPLLLRLGVQVLHEDLVISFVGRHV